MVVAAQLNLPSWAVIIGVALFYTVFVVGVVTARYRRGVTWLVGTVLLSTYGAVLAGYLDPQWTIGEVTVNSSMTFFSGEHDRFVEADLTVMLGLSHFNITYKDKKGTFEFNERFEMAPDVWDKLYRHDVDAKLLALRRGLPNPMISLAEQVGTYSYDFDWGPQFTYAGYVTYHFLTVAILAALASTFFLLVLPRWSMAALGVTGALLVLAATTHLALCPRTDGSLGIHVEGSRMNFCAGRTIFAILAVGILDISLAATVLAMKRFRLVSGHLATFLEMDFDTPWDARAIQEDSKSRRNQQQANKIPNGGFLRESVRRWTLKRRRRGNAETANNSPSDTIPLSPIGQMEAAASNEESDSFEASFASE